MASIPFASIIFGSFWLLAVATCQECEDATATASWVQMKVDKRIRSKASSYFWTKRGRDSSTSNSDFEVPIDFSKRPTWTFNNTNDEQVRHSPLIDDEKNIYLMTTTKLRKFSKHGHLQWTFTQEDSMTTSPTMHDNKIYLLAQRVGGGNIVAYALNMTDASVIWKVDMPGRSRGPDSQSLLLVKNRLILPGQIDSPKGDNGFVAINASNGDYLWEYATDEIIWNSSPCAADDTILFSSSCGTVFRISLDGKLLWKAGTQYGGKRMCGTGGGSLGPNDVFYSEYSDDSGGHIVAHRLSDGEKLWQRDFDHKHQGMQYPSIGRLGTDGPLAVVAALGENPGMPQPLLGGFREKYFSDASYRKELGAEPKANFIIALNAETGETIWEWEEELWDHFGAAGDEEGFIERLIKHNIENPVCLPDLQGIPVVNSLDGSVFASSGHGGNLTVIRDDNKDGIIDTSEVRSFAPGICFLNSPSMAPGMLVVSPCWGPTYVWLS